MIKPGQPRQYMGLVGSLMIPTGVSVGYISPQQGLHTVSIKVDVIGGSTLHTTLKPLTPPLKTYVTMDLTSTSRTKCWGSHTLQKSHTTIYGGLSDPLISKSQGAFSLNITYTFTGCVSTFNITMWTGCFNLRATSWIFEDSKPKYYNSQL